MDYFNLSTLFKKIVNFVKNIFNVYSLNNSITTNINNLIIRIQAIEIKLNQKFISSPTLNSTATIVPRKKN